MLTSTALRIQNSIWYDVLFLVLHTVVYSGPTLANSARDSQAQQNLVFRGHDPITRVCRARNPIDFGDIC